MDSQTETDVEKQPSGWRKVCRSVEFAIAFACLGVLIAQYVLEEPRKLATLITIALAAPFVFVAALNALHALPPDLVVLEKIRAAAIERAKKAGIFAAEMIGVRIDSLTKSMHFVSFWGGVSVPHRAVGKWSLEALSWRVAVEAVASRWFFWASLTTCVLVGSVSFLLATRTHILRTPIGIYLMPWLFILLGALCVWEYFFIALRADARLTQSQEDRDAAKEALGRSFFDLESPHAYEFKPFARWWLKKRARSLGITFERGFRADENQTPG